MQIQVNDDAARLRPSTIPFKCRKPEREPEQRAARRRSECTHQCRRQVADRLNELVLTAA